jgi:hypothetical protein
MFVLKKETRVDGYYSSYETLIACSESKEVLEKLIETLNEEKAEFLVKIGIASSIEHQTKIFNEFKTLSMYFTTYRDADEYWDFEIEEVKEIKTVKETKLTQAEIESWNGQGGSCYSHELEVVW